MEPAVSAPDQPLVVLEQVSYFYPGAAPSAPALRDVSLTIRRGEFLGLCGPTGAGKSTLCLLFNGIVPQFYGGRFFGRVTVAGLDTLEHPISVLSRSVGAVFQDPETQLIATSVENEVAFALENMGVPREQIRARIPEALAAVRLAGLERKHPHELSGGQKQRLAIAAVLALRPALLVLDEPTSQLDPAGEEEVFAVLHRLNREQGLSVVVASHAAEHLAEHADRVALLSGGRLWAVGTPREVFSRADLQAVHHVRPPQVTETFQLVRRPGEDVDAALPVRLAEGLSALPRLLAERGFVMPVLPAAAVVDAAAAPLLSVRDLRHRYPDGTEALRGVSLDIRRGEYVVLLGQNGAGKSTLVRHFLRLLLPSEGQVQVAGRDTRDLSVSELARRIGYVSQNPDQQIFNTTVAGEVSFALRNLRHPDAEVKARTEESLRAMGLWELRAQHPLSLPKGDRSRIVIAAVLAMRPEILILDEPTIGQDHRGARYILDLSRRLHEAGQTVLVITHHLHLLPGYAERALIMGRGTLLCDAPLRGAFHQHKTLAETFLRPPQAVLLAQALEEQLSMNLPLLTPAEIAAGFGA